MPLPDTRKTILFWTTLAIVVCGLFPPWLYTFYRTGTSDVPGMRSEKDAGCHFILTPPSIKSDPLYWQYSSTEREALGVKLDGERLLIEWVCILAVGGGVWARFRIDEEKSDSGNASVK